MGMGCSMSGPWLLPCAERFDERPALPTLVLTLPTLY